MNIQISQLIKVTCMRNSHCDNFEEKHRDTHAHKADNFLPHV